MGAIQERGVVDGAKGAGMAALPWCELAKWLIRPGAENVFLCCWGWQGGESAPDRGGEAREPGLLRLGARFDRTRETLGPLWKLVMSRLLQKKWVNWSCDSHWGKGVYGLVANWR